MNAPKIPVWLLPWTARRRISALEEELHASLQRHAETILKSDEIQKDHEATKQVESQNKRAIAALLAWIYATHKIDQRATEHGLTDILKEFPRKAS